jgi:hypothetical protein
MEISPDDLYETIRYDDEADTKEMIEIVDSYLPTTIELLTECVYERLLRSKDAYSIRIGKSLQHQLSLIISTEIVSDLAKDYLLKIKEMINE